MNTEKDEQLICRTANVARYSKKLNEYVYTKYQNVIQCIKYTN